MSNSVFPSLPGIAWPVKKIPIWSTKEMKAVSGKQSTLALYSYPIYRIELTFPDVLRDFGSFAGSTEFRTLLDFYNSMQGKFDTFLFDDITDNSVTAQQFGTGDGNNKVFQLIRSLKSGGFLEPVQNIHTLTNLFDNGSPISGGDYSISSTGVVTFVTAPVAAHVLTWTGTYYYRCRFLADEMEFEEFMSNYWSVKTIQFITVKL
jgi:hypothetical protein